MIKDNKSAKYHLEHPDSPKYYFTTELAKAFTTDDAIVLSVLIRICRVRLIPGTVLDNNYYVAATAKELHEIFFSFWLYEKFVSIFYPLIKAELISAHYLPSPYLADRAKQVIHYAPNYDNIYQAVLWTKNR